MLDFIQPDGITKCRPEFQSVEDMDEYMIRKWNDVVKPGDTVYHLGDVAINKKYLTHLDRLNGRKVLVKGNHDIFKLKDYQKYFDDIRSYLVFADDGMICSHIPLHPQQLSGRFKGNIHGHLHYNKIDDPRYLNMCVEHWNYTPQPLDEILKLMKERLGS